MTFLITLACTSLAVAILQKPLKRWPVVFYAFGIVLTILYLYLNTYGASVFLWKYLLVFFQRCTIGLALFTLVMFVRVLPENSKARIVISSLRRELSILGAIFTSGHIIAYLTAFLPQIMTNLELVKLNLGLSLLVSCVITVLLIILTITSFTAVRTRMNAQTWKRIQMLAYPFYALVYVHLLIVLFPSALAGSGTVALNLLVYTVIFVVYGRLRIKKYLQDKKIQERVAAPSTQA